MEQSIKNYIIRDPHGNVKKQSGFSVVSEVEVSMTPGVGEPSASSRYEDGKLYIELHNLKGEAITGITFEPSEEDGGTNYLHISTDAEDGENKYTFPIKNRYSWFVAPKACIHQYNQANAWQIILETGLTF